MNDNILAISKQRHMEEMHNITQQGSPDIALTAREILENKIDTAIQKYPTALRPEHIQNILDCSRTSAYTALPNIPGAKKIDGLGWRIPKETFFAWWYGKEENNG